MKGKIWAIIFAVWVVLVISGCSNSGKEAKNPAHYFITKEIEGYSSAQSWYSTMSAEINNGMVLSGKINTWHSDFMSNKRCNATYNKDEGYCWEGICEEIFGENNKTKEGNLKWSCNGISHSTPEGKNIETYGDVMVIIEDMIKRVEKGGEFGGVQGYKKLEKIYRNKKGCNEIVCFKNGYLTHFAIISKGWSKWDIEIVDKI